jgi:RNA polymerase primary sigma factor
VSFDDPLRVYVAELQSIPPLSRDEEIDCVQRVLAGGQLAESAGKRLAEANLLLVVSIAERFQNNPVHILDLIQKGNEGLLRAVGTVRDSRHDSFSAHATDHIERAIAEAISNSGSTSV